jgi:hypothetical protein
MTLNQGHLIKTVSKDNIDKPDRINKLDKIQIITLNK